MTKKGHRKPAAFRVEEVELFLPPVAPEVSAEATPLPARVRTLPDLSRGLRWGSILVGALGGLIGLLASIWLYDYVLALLARDDWIGWLAIGLIALVASSRLYLEAHWFLDVVGGLLLGVTYLLLLIWAGETLEARARGRRALSS